MGVLCVLWEFCDRTPIIQLVILCIMGVLWLNISLAPPTAKWEWVRRAIENNKTRTWFNVSVSCFTETVLDTTDASLTVRVLWLIWTSVDLNTCYP